MFIYANRNIIFRSQDGSQVYPVRRGFVGQVPDWVGETPYFHALVKDGKVSVPNSAKDKDLQAAEERPTKVRRGKKETAE